jgi:hypothetical protein
MRFQIILKKKNRSSCKNFQGCISKVIFGPILKNTERNYKSTVMPDYSNCAQFISVNKQIFYKILSPFHTRRRPRRPRCVLNFFRERSEGVVKIGIVCITRFFLRSWYVPYRFLLRPPRSHQVIITRTVTRALRPLRLNCAFFLITTRKTFPILHHASFTF